MLASRSTTTRAVRLGRAVVLALLATFVAGQDSCVVDPPPVFPGRPLALDCVVGGSQVYVPLDVVVDSDRYLVALTGALVDASVTARVPADAFCAMEAAGYTQIDLDFARLTMSVTGVTAPDPPEIPMTASGLPVTDIDIAQACAGALGSTVDIDFGTVTSNVWAAGDWFVQFLVTLQGIDVRLANVHHTSSPGAPIPSMPLLDLCEPTDKSEPPNGTTDDPEDSPRIAADMDVDGTFDALAPDDVQARYNVTGFCAGFRCDDGNECTIDHCDVRNMGWCTYTNEDDGSACDFGGMLGACSSGGCIAICDYVDCDDGNECTTSSCEPTDGSCNTQPVPDDTPCAGGTGVCRSGACALPVGSGPQTKAITLACTNNASPDLSLIPFDLTVDPTPNGGDITAVVDGVARLPELFLDVAQSVPGGMTQAAVLDVSATVHVRSGASGADVTLKSEPIPHVCWLAPTTSCDPANDQPSVPGFVGNSDCAPTGSFNPCVRLVPIPTSTDCEPGGLCETLGKALQCSSNGFCVTGPLPLPLEAQVADYTPDGSGTVLFGWDDESTGATLEPDGTWALPTASSITDPTGPNGIRINVGVQAALECTMSVDSGGPLGVGVPGAASPAPDSALMAFTP